MLLQPVKGLKGTGKQGFRFLIKMEVKLMRKYASILLAVVLGASLLVGCGGSGKST